MDNRIDEILEITSLVPTSELKPEPVARVLPKQTARMTMLIIIMPVKITTI